MDSTQPSYLLGKLLAGEILDPSPDLWSCVLLGSACVAFPSDAIRKMSMDTAMNLVLTREQFFADDDEDLAVGEDLEHEFCELWTWERRYPRAPCTSARAGPHLCAVCSLAKETLKRVGQRKRRGGRKRGKR